MINSVIEEVSLEPLLGEGEDVGGLMELLVNMLYPVSYTHLTLPTSDLV